MSNQYIKFNLKPKYSIQRQTYVFLSTPKQCIQFNLTHMSSFQRQTYVLNFIQIYHVWERYLRKIPVERRKISRAEWRGKFSLKTGIFRKYPSQT